MSLKELIGLYNKKIKWNGDYGVEKVKALIVATPVGEIMKRHQGYVNNDEKKTENFMLNLIGSLEFFRYLH